MYLRVLGMLVVFGLRAAPAGAQVPPDSIADTITCRMCRLETRVSVGLGDADGPGAIPGNPNSIIVDGRGWFWAVFQKFATVQVFSADGRFLRTGGRSGAGPGELSYPNDAFAVGDSVAIYDRLGSVTIFGPDGSFVRSVSLADPRPVDFLVLDWPRTVMVSAVGRGAELIGWPLHILELFGNQATVRARRSA